jgi:uncharacterized delta-60 repeat protein
VGYSHADGLFNLNAQFALIRYHANGTIDSTFGINGIAEFTINGLNATAHAAELQSDGKILVTGFTSAVGSGQKAVLVRLNTDGSLDSTFGNYGAVLTSVNCAATTAYAIQLSTDGIFIGGVVAEYEPFYNLNLAVMKYLNDDCLLPEADFGYSTSGNEVSFQDQSANTDSWLWDFGDGNFSTLQFPVHMYMSAGIYDVCLIAENDCGTDTFCLTVEVISTSVAGNFQNSNLKILPNPFSSRFVLEMNLAAQTEFEIRIRTINGIMLKSWKRNTLTGKFIEWISLNDVAAGCYILEIVSQEFSVARLVCRQ